MRPKIAVWTDYRSPTPKRWKSPYRRSTRPSIGLKVLLAAVVLVAGVVGISGIYPQVIELRMGAQRHRYSREATCGRRGDDQEGARADRRGPAVAAWRRRDDR